jgi:hypothetical protein
MDNSLEVILQKVCEKRDQIVDAVANNAAKDYADYKQLCGEIRGLSIAEGFILDLKKIMEQSDD